MIVMNVNVIIAVKIQDIRIISDELVTKFKQILHLHYILLLHIPDKT